jgi:hypothetical protein
MRYSATAARRAASLTAVSALAKCVFLLVPLVAAASDDKVDRATLRGIKGVCTVVEVLDQTKESAAGLSQEKLQSDIQSKLQQAGIVIEKDSTNCLYFSVRPLPAIGKNNKPIGLYAVDFKLEFLQAVTLARDTAIRAYAPTWSVSNLANVPAVDVERTAREVAADLVSRFVRAYRSVNSK